jgi:hypothetical protein
VPIQVLAVLLHQEATAARRALVTLVQLMHHRAVLPATQSPHFYIGTTQLYNTITTSHKHHPAVLPEKQHTILTSAPPSCTA